MKTYSISQLARAFGLSRSTLLYYDHIRLLPASGRTTSGYRIYSEKDRRRLEKIRTFRQTGLPLEQVQRLLQTQTSGSRFTATLRRRLGEISGQITHLKNQQRLLVAMLQKTGEGITLVDKPLWVKMMREAGLDDDGMARWHREFEHRSPQSHHEFLASLGISEAEIQDIRHSSAHDSA